MEKQGQSGTAKYDWSQVLPNMVCMKWSHCTFTTKHFLAMLVKVEVIEHAKKNPSQSSHKIAEVVNCEHTHIQSIPVKINSE